MKRKKPRLKFTYKEFKGGSYPIIKISLKGPKGILEVEAFVDSGASVSIFHASLASELGINYRNGKISYTLVGDGSYIPVYIKTVSVKLGHYSFSAQIGFSPQLGAEVNLLGHNGFFERFVITFHGSQKTITFIPAKR